MNSSFEKAKLCGANLSRTVTQMAGPVQGATFRGADLRDAKLTNVKMEHSYFDEANLDNTDFSDSHLRSCTFRRATMRNTNFSGADLTASVIERLAQPVRYDARTKWPDRFSPEDIGRTPFQGICPRCGSRCQLNTAPFSQFASVFFCPRGDFTAVQCPSCKNDVLAWIKDLDNTVYMECGTCRHASTGIPKDWWHKNVHS